MKSQSSVSAVNKAKLFIKKFIDSLHPPVTENMILINTIVDHMTVCKSFMADTKFVWLLN